MVNFHFLFFLIFLFPLWINSVLMFHNFSREIYLFATGHCPNKKFFSTTFLPDFSYRWNFICESRNCYLYYETLIFNNCSLVVVFSVWQWKGNINLVWKIPPAIRMFFFCVTFLTSHRLCWGWRKWKKERERQSKMYLCVFKKGEKNYAVSQLINFS